MRSQSEGKEDRQTSANHPKLWTATDIALDHPAWAPFEAWAQARLHAKGSRPLTPKSVDHYRHIWRIWLKFLESREPKIAWNTARSEDVAAFLNAILPSSNRRRTSASASPVTQARYRSTLAKVYRSAVQAVRLSGSAEPVLDPTADLQDSEAHPETETSESEWLSPVVRSRLLERLEDVQPGSQQARDRAIVSLIMFEALTVAEVRGLKLEGVLFMEPMPNDLFLRSSPAAIEVEGKGGIRTIRLSRRTSLALNEWILDRSELDARGLDLLFIPLRGQGNQLSAKTVFVTVNLFLQAALIGARGGDGQVHGGPNLLRNGAIQQWIEAGFRFHEIVRRLGLDGHRCVRRLVRLAGPQIQARYAKEQKTAREAGWPATASGGDDSALEVAPSSPTPEQVAEPQHREFDAVANAPEAPEIDGPLFADLVVRHSSSRKRVQQLLEAITDQEREFTLREVLALVGRAPSLGRVLRRAFVELPGAPSRRHGQVKRYRAREGAQKALAVHMAERFA